MKMTCAFVDVCMPCYWSGHTLPHIAVPVNSNMTFADLCRALVDELRARYVAGAAAPEDTYEDSEWLIAAIAAVCRDVRPIDQGVEYAFDLDGSENEDEDGQMYAYFVFVQEDE